MPRAWRSLFAAKKPEDSPLDEVRRLRSEYQALNDSALTEAARVARTLPEVIAACAVVASRVLGVQMFDVQLRGALALASGRIAEMQTGEGKTLAAVPAVVWYARPGRGVHVLTANDYLARRDAAWMEEIYRWVGLSVGAIEQRTTRDERRAAYALDVTYATANEVGFDYLRDQLALHSHEQVLRPFTAAVIDEADSILIDEARIPLVIAGGTAGASGVATAADHAVGRLQPHLHFTIEQAGRSVLLTPAGVAEIERGFLCGSLYDERNLPVMAAVQEALHAHVLLRRDVDYVVNGDAILSVDELKGRIVPERRWPAGLQTALEVKERVSPKKQGKILGSITIENLVGLYPEVCGMTGTAATQANEFREIYGLDVEVIPTNRPVLRVDHPDQLFPGARDKERAAVEEIQRTHATGRPVLVGTSSVEESERVSRLLGHIPHTVLNARNEEAEAAIIARAGEQGAVTISTNMAGRGVDIKLEARASELGGLHVIGTNRHESRRIDHQLRGRAGRQGDPGSSQFFVSSEDALMMKHGADDPELRSSPDAIQRITEGQSLDIRLFLRKYESVLEAQRLVIAEERQGVLGGTAPSASELERLVKLSTIDELWSDYLSAVAELRAGTVWVSLGYGEPFRDYLHQVHTMFEELQWTIDDEVPKRLAMATIEDFEARQRGATWTYLTTDEPFGTMTARVMRGLVSMIRKGIKGRR